MQGDERDVILFSLAFSTNPGTEAAAELRPAQPLRRRATAQRGGDPRAPPGRALHSFDPIDIDLSRTLDRAGPPAGIPRDGGSWTWLRPRVLRDFARDRSTNPVQESIAAALRTRGYEVQTNYGLSEFILDIVVREPASDRWQVAIVLDGPRWATRPPCPTATSPLACSNDDALGSLAAGLAAGVDRRARPVLDRVDAAVATANERRRRYDEQLAADAEARAAAIAEAEAHPPSEVSDDEPPVDGGAGQTELVWDVGPTDPPPATATDTRLVAGLAAPRFRRPSASTWRLLNWDGRPAAYQHAPTSMLATAPTSTG